jgi:hypothetical protein
VVFLDGGEIVEAGPARPKDERTKRFVSTLTAQTALPTAEL